MEDALIDLSFLSAVALAGLAYLLGELVVHLLPVLRRYYIPEPLIGGMLAALGLLGLRIAGVEVTLPVSGRAVDFLMALLTTHMGLHVTPMILRKGARLFPLFFSAGVALYALQFLLVTPVVLVATDHYLASATLWGPISFVGAPFNLNPPGQFVAIESYFTPAYPDVTELGQGQMMIGALAAIALPGILGRRIMTRVDQAPPKPSPSRQRIPEPVWSIATDEAALLVLVLTTIASAFWFQSWLLDQLDWMKPDYLPVIVISYLAGAAFRLGYEAVMGKRRAFPQFALNTMLLGPTMAIVLAYAVTAIPLYKLRLVTAQMAVAAVLAIASSVVVAWFAYPLFARVANHYAAGAASVVLLGITTGWGPMAMSYLRRFTDEEGQPELIPAVLPMHAFFLFPWLAALMSKLLFEIAG